MYVNIKLLEYYCNENGLEINTNIDIESSEPILKFVRGGDKDGSRVEFLGFQEFHEILLLNGVIGENGIVKDELIEMRNNFKDGKGDAYDSEQKIEIAIYDTLAKYILQMFNAGRGEILFSHIVPIAYHKETYFRAD